MWLNIDARPGKVNRSVEYPALPHVSYSKTGTRCGNHMIILEKACPAVAREAPGRPFPSSNLAIIGALATWGLPRQNLESARHRRGARNTFIPHNGGGVSGCSRAFSDAAAAT